MVDREEHRARIARVAAEVIACEGVEAATVRRVSAAAGYSTSIVTYYFSGKHELLLAAYRSLDAELVGKIDAVLTRDPADLVGCLLCMTAADEVSIKRWRTYVALWGQAARDESWARQSRLDVESAISLIRDVICTRNGEMASSDALSRNLNAFVQGISVQALNDPARWSPQEIRETLEELVQKLVGPRTLADEGQRLQQLDRRRA